MNALRAVPDDSDGSADNAGTDSASVVEVLTSLADELAYDPATDPEALLLCALMWSNHTGGLPTEDRRIAAVLTDRDFEITAYGRLFTVLASLITAGEHYDPASVTMALVRSGADGEKDASLRRRLNEVITARADGYKATHYADMVLSQSYRRSFHAVGAAIAEAATQLPEEDLFEHMVEHGRRQRAAYERLNQFRSGQTDTGGDPA
ncbi:hypothetical protein CH253_17880 [Rhodococcus sp. 06-156-3C]|uniref:DnaB-like helicase N-terminal domain-containing protein n=1 Tax=Nocardiaceae TaxID=85025 RepID=UPI00068D3369|nr:MULTISPECIES: DnaB-like helicase N-terminal domain-containing protein [Rhodococcus]OZD18329.1 hypothetical protein CH280_07205 [Rhodococcus sp. 06-156-4C]OZD18927.1 hypothetical protein CH253_17880 [Rhodococcus sp. 06-156-3C]OZD22437.1 hypothetical protein CH248_09465 [Rhodococcus sp. 06-156-4a]OZD34021.1 hypothetical protein CH247_07995 [Rhodococcus sp. 06-156-3b]OZD38758.1 hypothetical protein CH284_06415 [Rhodococcus sp. 06-156-3]